MNLSQRVARLEAAGRGPGGVIRIPDPATLTPEERAALAARLRTEGMNPASILIAADADLVVLVGETDARAIARRHRAVTLVRSYGTAD